MIYTILYSIIYGLRDFIRIVNQITVGLFGITIAGYYFWSIIEGMPLLTFIIQFKSLIFSFATAMFMLIFYNIIFDAVLRWIATRRS